jgi:hypothetical protein
MNNELDLGVDDLSLHLWQLKKGDKFMIESTNEFYRDKVFKFVKIDGAYSIVIHDEVAYHPHANTFVRLVGGE